MGADRDPMQATPHVLELFVSDHCRGCPAARAQVGQFAARHALTVIERNVDAERDAAARYGLCATPALVIDGRTVLYGVPTQTQLAARLVAPVD